MLIHRIAAQLYTAEALQAVEAGLDAGEDVTLAVSQSGRTLMAAAQFARRPRPTVYIVSGEDAADRAARSLAAYVGLAHVCRFPERKDYPWREQAPDDAVVAQRCEALGRIVRGDNCIMVASARALLRCVPEYGKLYVLAPFFIAFAGDSLSMGFGMWFGKRKMAPHVSPHKTWAGGIGGPIGSALGMVLLGFIGSHWLGYTPDYFKLISVGVMANIFGQLGDLSMSLIKREAGIKDYSHIFLTHGGMLDRFDSTLFIAPIVYLCVGAGTI